MLGDPLSLLDLVGVGLIAFDQLGTVHELNELATRITGWAPNEAVGAPLAQIWRIAPLSLALLSLRLWHSEVAAESGESGGHAVVSRRDGSLTPVEWRRVRLPPDKGNAGLILFWELAPFADVLESAHRLAAIVASSSDAIVSKTTTGMVTSWNAGAETLFGYTASEMIGQPIRRLIPADRQYEEDDILSKINAGQRIPPFDTLRLHKDGSLLDVSVTMSPILGIDGRIVGASKIARSNDERNRRQRLELEAMRLEAANQQMLEAGRLRLNFFTRMSHELRTPLNAVIGFAQLLLTKPTVQADGQVTQGLKQILRGGHHVLQLVNEVLDLAKLEAGTFTFVPVPVHIGQLAEEVTSVLEPLFLERRIKLQTEVDPSIGELYLDPLRLKQVLYNYLSNAVKFSPPDETVSLTIQLEGPAYFRIEVRDKGPGISPALQSSLFADFVQLSTAFPASDGTGLGLALTRTLVEAQGGHVGVLSAEGAGAIFFATLPRRMDSRIE